MNNKYLIIAAAIMMASACEKNLTDPESPKFNPIPATIEVSIAGSETPDTKLGYTLDANVLKSSWKKGDKISVISYYIVGPGGGAYGKIVANDVFTAESAGESVKFSGTFSNPTPETGGVIDVRIMYPALEGTPLASPKEPENDEAAHGPFYIGDDKFLHLDSGRKYIQPDANSVDNLKYYTLMLGFADLAQLQSCTLTVASLAHFTYIIKADLTMPDNGNNYLIKKVSLIGQSTGSDSYIPTLRSWGSADFKTLHFSSSHTQLHTYMSDVKSDGSVSDTGVTFNKGATTTVYFVGGFGSTSEVYKFFNGLSQLKVVAEGTKSGTPCTLSKTLTAGGDIVLVTGNIYRLSATLAED